MSGDDGVARGALCADLISIYVFCSARVRPYVGISVGLEALVIIHPLS